MAEEQQQINDAHAVLQAAEEFEQVAEQFQQWGHDSAAESARARAYELRQVLHRLIPAIGTCGVTVLHHQTKPATDADDASPVK